jgi:hypothetical protein
MSDSLFASTTRLKWNEKLLVIQLSLAVQSIAKRKKHKERKTSARRTHPNAIFATRSGRNSFFVRLAALLACKLRRTRSRHYTSALLQSLRLQAKASEQKAIICSEKHKFVPGGRRFNSIFIKMSSCIIISNALEL